VRKVPGSQETKSHLNVLAVVEEAHSTRRCLAAAALASKVAPHTTLTALHIEVDPAQIITAPEEISLQKMRTPTEGSASDRAKRVRRMFEFWCAGQHSLNAAWVSKAGTVETVLAAEAANANLIVVAKPHNMDSFDALHGALFEARKLVLFVPDTNNLASVHRKMIIAWKDHAQATRAVEQALPWLAAAEQVVAVSVQEGDKPQFDALRRILSAQGVKADYRILPTDPGEHPSSRILREAKAEGADSVVMGAFRFGMIAEWFFGGVTREILHTADIPLFLRH
jgi:nucleotide-binding universal stress UspA family protein